MGWGTGSRGLAQPDAILTTVATCLAPGDGATIVSRLAQQLVGVLRGAQHRLRLSVSSFAATPAYGTVADHAEVSPDSKPSVNTG